jgi:hypothetical protein
VAAPRLIAAAPKAGLLAKPTNVIALMIPIARTLVARRIFDGPGRLCRTEMKRKKSLEIESGWFGAGSEPIRHTTLKTELSSISTRLKTGFFTKKLTVLFNFFHTSLSRIDD